MKIQQAGDGLGRDLRSVAGENDYVVVGSEWLAGDDEGVSSPALLGLQYEVDSSVVEGGSDAEQAYADSMTGDYLKAVAATLNAMRRLAEAASSANTGAVKA